MKFTLHALIWLGLMALSLASALLMTQTPFTY